MSPPPIAIRVHCFLGGFAPVGDRGGKMVDPVLDQPDGWRKNLSRGLAMIQDQNLPALLDRVTAGILEICWE